MLTSVGNIRCTVSGQDSEKVVILSGTPTDGVFRGGFMFEGLFQPMHLVVIFGIALLVFGPRKLPELGKGLGEGIRGFKSALKSENDCK